MKWTFLTFHQQFFTQFNNNTLLPSDPLLHCAEVYTNPIVPLKTIDKARARVLEGLYIFF